MERLIILAVVIGINVIKKTGLVGMVQESYYNRRHSKPEWDLAVSQKDLQDYVAKDLKSDRDIQVIFEKSLELVMTPHLYGCQTEGIKGALALNYQEKARGLELRQELVTALEELTQHGLMDYQEYTQLMIGHVTVQTNLVRLASVLYLLEDPLLTRNLLHEENAAQYQEVLLSLQSLAKNVKEVNDLFELHDQGLKVAAEEQLRLEKSREIEAIMDLSGDKIFEIKEESK